MPRRSALRFHLLLGCTLCCPLLASDHFLCSCRVNLPQFVPASPGLSSTMPRVRDWSLVVASCHASLTEWHQASVPAHSPTLLNAALDTVFSSLTQILFDGASFHSHRRPATTPPCFRRREPLLVERRLVPRPWLLAAAPGVTSVA